MPGSGLPLSWMRDSWSPATKIFECPLNAQVFADDYSTLTVYVEAMVFAQLNTPNSGCPENGSSSDSLFTYFDSVLVNFGHKTVRPNLHAKSFEVSRRVARLRFTECWRQPRHRHLVQQRLKQVIVLAVHKSNVDAVSITRFPGSIQFSESTSYDDDVFHFLLFI